jgi:hypothetical protein
VANPRAGGGILSTFALTRNQSVQVRTPTFDVLGRLGHASVLAPFSSAIPFSPFAALEHGALQLVD